MGGNRIVGSGLSAPNRAFRRNVVRGRSATTPIAMPESVPVREGGREPRRGPVQQVRIPTLTWQFRSAAIGCH